MTIDDILTDPANKVVIQALKSVRNGFIYGSRLRFAHALVVSILFKRNIPLQKRLTKVIRLAKDHGAVLGTFVFIYKIVLLSLNELLGKKSINEFVAGAIGGGVAFGNQSSLFNHSIAHQISLYCGARVALALGKLLAYKIAKVLKESKVIKSNDKRSVRNAIQSCSWTTFVSLIWGLVMYLHRYYPSYLQPSLEFSMVYIYDDWKWNDWRSFLGL